MNKIGIVSIYMHTGYDLSLSLFLSLIFLYLEYNPKGQGALLTELKIIIFLRGDIWESSSSQITSQIISQYEITNSPIGDSNRLNDVKFEKLILHHLFLGFCSLYSDLSDFFYPIQHVERFEYFAYRF